MSITEKTRTAKLAEHCLRCFAPGIFIKGNSDANNHHQKNCDVTHTTKHKFSCLKKTCLKHSWICRDHIEENVPLLDAHWEELAASMNELREPLNNKGIKAKANITRNTTDSQSRTPHSWNHLCLGTDRKHPNSDNIFKSTTYARRPKYSQTRAITNPKCRICKILENTGNYKGDLYANHTGNLPTNCPQWTNMDLIQKRRTSYLADYCLRCFAPNVFIKSELDRARHHKNECYVSATLLDLPNPLL